MDTFPNSRGRAPILPGTFDPIIPPERKLKVERPSGKNSSDRSTFGRQPRRLLLCFSHLRWDFVWQRPQHLLSRAAASYRVVVLEEPQVTGGQVTGGKGPALSLSTRPEGVEVAVPVLPEGCTEQQAVAAQRHLLERFLAQAGNQDPIFWYYTPMAMGFSGHCHRVLTVYDNMDELSSFRGASPELLAREQDLLLAADVVFTGGLSLFEAKRDRHRSVHAFPSSIDASHFGKARQHRLASSVAPPRTAQPHLGFFGVIDERLDLELVAAAADLRPDWQFTMVGPVVKIDPASLPQRRNIAWSGACAYANLPAELAAWDVGMMPFAINEATRFISPTKTPEFLAAGVPVVSTPVADVVRSYGSKGLVEIAASASEFVEAAERLMARPKQACSRRSTGNSPPVPGIAPGPTCTG